MDTQKFSELNTGEQVKLGKADAQKAKREAARWRQKSELEERQDDYFKFRVENVLASVREQRRGQEFDEEEENKED